MKSKKLTALIMAISILSTATIMQVSAETAKNTSPSTGTSKASQKTETSKKDDENLKSALTKVKERVEIPAEYSTFKYSKNTYQGDNSYSFTWTNENGGTINISISGDIITNYNTYDGSEKYGYSNNDSKASFAKLSNDELKKKAELTAKQLNPTIYSNQKLELSYISLTGSAASFSISREENGITVNGNTGSVEINKDTGKLTSYYLTWWDNAEFADPKTAKTEKEIQESYKELCSLTPKYKIIHDSETDKDSVILVYIPDFFSEIDAFTGKKSTIWDDYKEAMDTSNYGEKGGMAYEETTAAANDGAGESDTNSVNFTEEEKKAIEKNNNLLSQEKIIEKIKADKYINLTSDYVLSNALLSESYEDTGKFTWSVNYNVNTKTDYKYLYVNLDAETGKILNFSKYNGKYGDEKEKKSINVATANKTAAAAAEYYLLDIMKEYKADKENTDKSATTKDYTEQSRYFRFTRYANDIEVENDYVSLEVNSDNEVMSFDYDYHDVTFPSNKMISTDTAFAKLFAHQKFDYYYDGFTTLNGNAKTYLIYCMNSFYMNAKTGKLVDYNGIEITEPSEGSTYSDIKGHWAEKYINKLADYGLTLSSDNGKFNPDNSITEEEFQNLLNQIFYSYSPYPYYEYADASNVMDVSRTTVSNPEGAVPAKRNSITKAEATKLFVTAMGGNTYAELKGIYTVPFKDVKSSRADIGYIAIAYANGFAYVDSNGNFNPDSKVSRGMAMYLIYRYLSN